MSVPTLTNDMTLFDDCDSAPANGWGVDDAKWDVETELPVLEGVGSCALVPKNTGDGGNGFIGTAFNADTNIVLVWVWIIDPSFVEITANHGVYVRLASGSDWTSNYEDYDVGGSDADWVGRGWKLIALDRTSRTADRSNGTLATTAVTRVGVGKNGLSTSLKSVYMAIDIIQIGTYVELTTPSFTDGSNGIDFNENGASADTIDRNDGGSWITDGYEVGDLIRVDNATDDGIYELTVVATSVLTVNIGDFTADDIADTDAIVSLFCTLEDIYQKDGPTDDAWTGIVSKNRDGALEINYTLILGDQSGALDSHFLSRGETIFFADQPLGTGGLLLQSAEDTGTTRILFGDSSGTGEDRVGFAGSTITQDNRIFASDGTIDFDVAVTDCEVYGTTFLGIGGGATFSTTTTHRIFNTTFNGCGQVDLGAVQARNNIFSGYDIVADAALLWNASIDITDSQFLANRNTTGNATAIEHTASGSFSYDTLKFAGNDYDIVNTVSPSGNVTINATDSNPSTWETTNGWVDIINSVFITITLEDTLGNPVPSGSAAVYKTSDDSELMREYATIAGVAIEPFNYLSDTNIYVRIRKSSPGETRYLPYTTAGTITEDGYTLAAVLIEDSIAG